MLGSRGGLVDTVPLAARARQRATDAEIAQLDDFLSTAATVRQRRMWVDAEGGLVLVDDVLPLAEALFGAERAAELLA